MATGFHNEKPMIVRINQAMEKIIEHPAFKHQVGIAIPLNDPRPDGFCDKHESQQIAAIEDQICDLLSANNESLYCIAISGDGMCEFVFYTSNPEGVKQYFESLRTTVDTHELQMIIQHDPEWKIFQQFRISAKGKTWIKKYR